MSQSSRTWKSLLTAVSESLNGGVSTLFAFALPAALVVALGAVELMSLSADRARLQDAADTTALNAASQMQLAANGALLERTREFASAQVSGLTAKMDPPDVDFIAESGAPAGVQVTLTARRPSFFGNLLPPGGFVIQATGRAQKLARNPLCILSLSERHQKKKGAQTSDTAKKADALNVQAGAVIARSCMVYSNDNISLGKLGRIDAASVQAVGVIRGKVTNSGAGAAPLDDPLSATFANSTLGMCPSKTGHVIQSGQEYAVAPGVLCGELVANPGSTLTFEPGVHHLKEGTLVLKRDVTVIGKDVTLVIWPGWQILSKGSAAALSLSGTTTGPWAGFALAVHPDHQQDLVLNFQEIRKLEGVVYVPGGSVIVPGGGIDPTEVTPWTVIVAKALKVQGGRQLQINTNYETSAVPVPDGVGNKVGGGAPVQLIR